MAFVKVLRRLFSPEYLKTLDAQTFLRGNYTPFVWYRPWTWVTSFNGRCFQYALFREWVWVVARTASFINDWVLTTNHRRLAILYFGMIAVTGFAGLTLATLIRIELAYPGHVFLGQNAERYLTIISLHGIVMVFFVVIPALYGAFGNFLLPTQLGIRDVAFPRLNSFMFWVTPAGFVLLMHILLFDRTYSLTYWVNYSELRARLRRRYLSVETPQAEARLGLVAETSLAWRSVTPTKLSGRGVLVSEYAPQLGQLGVDMWAGAEVAFDAVAPLERAVQAIHAKALALYAYGYTLGAHLQRGMLDVVAFGYRGDLFATGAAQVGAVLRFLVEPGYQVLRASLGQFCRFEGGVHFLRIERAWGAVLIWLRLDRQVSTFLLPSLKASWQWVVGLRDFWASSPLRRLLCETPWARVLTGVRVREGLVHVWPGVLGMPSLQVGEGALGWRQLKARLWVWLVDMVGLGVRIPAMVGVVPAEVGQGEQPTVPLRLRLDDVTLSGAGWAVGDTTGDATVGSPYALRVQSGGGVGAQPLGTLRALTSHYSRSWWQHDFWMDWRELKLEREVWRSLDLLSQSRQSLTFRRKYYAELFEPAAVTSKVSTWLPNQLIPGWAFITPYSSRLRYAAIGKVDIALIVVFMASLGSVFSSINYVITYRYIGAPILKNRRELRSFYVDALLVGSRMMILANPALLIGILLLLSDRHFNTSVFDFSGGGDTILFQHLFWFFGHPEVYIIIIPCFGFMNSLLPHYLRKRLSGRLSLQFSMYTIAFMGFAVWGHHMYMVGLANSVRTLYSTMTVMISVPASTKVLHWCVTLVQSTLVLDVGLLFLLNFMYFFVLGGLSGMFVAHIGFDTLFHDTFYVIGHFHVMLAGAAMSCIFAAFYFYFAAIFGVRYSRFFAYLHWGFYTGGQLLTLIPMFWLGYAGMPRRIMDYPTVFGGWHSIITSGHFLTVLSLIFFLFMLLDSFYENRAPIARMRGVSRLNNRLSFYAYETRKLRHYQAKALVLQRPAGVTSRAPLYAFCWQAETTVIEYVFTAR